MKSKYRSSFFLVFIVVLSILLGGNYWMKTNVLEANKKELINHLENLEHFMSSDALADRIINDDPSLYLIDLRTSEEFKKYHIPGAISLTLDSALVYLDKESEDLLKKDVVLISNDTFNSELIYALSDSKEHLNVLDGGMQSWYKHIINPKKADNNSDLKTIETYATRKGASMYFGVKYPEPVVKKVTVKKVTIPKKVVPVKKKKKLPIEGGC